jgi:hypothetical protein
VKKGTDFDVPDGIIAYLTGECGWNVNDEHIVEVTLYKLPDALPLWVTGFLPDCPAKRAATLTEYACFRSAPFNGRAYDTDVPHTRNNWLCCDFKQWGIVSTHCAIRTNSNRAGSSHLKSWLIETSVDGEKWLEVDRKENNKERNGRWLTVTFAVTRGEECRFIRLVNVGKNHRGNDLLLISGWEIFGGLLE